MSYELGIVLFVLLIAIYFINNKLQEKVKAGKIISLQSRVQNSYLRCPVCSEVSHVKKMTYSNCESVGTLSPELIGDLKTYLELSLTPEISPKLTCVKCSFKKLITNCPSCKKFVQLKHWHIGNQ